MYHSLALFAVAWLAEKGYPRADLAGKLFLAGIVLFSGSLYILTLAGIRWMGAVTPAGGAAFIVAWIVLALAPRRTD